MLEIFETLNIGAVLICGLIVLSNPQKTNLHGNRWLGIFLICFWVQLFQNGYDLSFQQEYLNIINVFTLLCLFTIPISFYLSISYFITSNRKLSTKDLILLLVHFLYLILLTFFYLKNSSLLLFSDTNMELPMAQEFFVITLSTFLISTFIYWMLGNRNLVRYSSNIKYYSTAEEELNLRWLHNINNGYIAMTLIWVVSIFTEIYWTYLLAHVAYFYGCFYILTNSLKQKELFPVDQNENSQLQKFLTEVLENTQKSSPVNQLKETGGEYILLKTKLLDYMDSHSPHLDNDLNLIRLANDLSISSNKLSYLLNNVLDSSFSSFINGYRAKEAQKIILDPQKSHFTMMQVAYEAGYSSKTVFNTHFKKTTNLTPSAFRDKHA